MTKEYSESHIGSSAVLFYPTDTVSNVGYLHLFLFFYGSLLQGSYQEVVELGYGRNQGTFIG